MASSISLVPAFRVPDDLTELDQWLLWRRERETKVPQHCRATGIKH